MKRNHMLFMAGAAMLSLSACANDMAGSQHADPYYRSGHTGRDLRASADGYRYDLEPRSATYVREARNRR